MQLRLGTQLMESPYTDITINPNEWPNKALVWDASPRCGLRPTA